MEPGTYELGPEEATLRVKTARKGAASRAGHDLVIEVTSWSARLELADDPAASRLELDADARSLRVREGTGGVMELGDDDRREIEQTIDDEVLGGRPIGFRSSAVEAGADGARLRVRGDLELAGSSGPIEFELRIEPDGAIAGAATVKQSAWRIKPYTALFGALKVADEVEVVAEGRARG